MLVLVWSLKWLHANVGIKYSRWEKHLEMLVERSGCVVIWSAILCLDRRHVSEHPTWAVYLEYSGPLQGFFPEGKDRTSGPWSNFLFIWNEKQWGWQCLSTSLLFQGKSHISVFKNKLKIAVNRLDQDQHKIQLYNCFLQIGYSTLITKLNNQFMNMFCKKSSTCQCGSKLWDRMEGRGSLIIIILIFHAHE